MVLWCESSRWNYIYRVISIILGDKGLDKGHVRSIYIVLCLFKEICRFMTVFYCFFGLFVGRKKCIVSQELKRRKYLQRN